MVFWLSTQKTTLHGLHPTIIEHSFPAIYSYKNQIWHFNETKYIKHTYFYTTQVYKDSNKQYEIVRLVIYIYKANVGIFLYKYLCINIYVTLLFGYWTDLQTVFLKLTRIFRRGFIAPKSMILISPDPYIAKLYNSWAVFLH